MLETPALTQTTPQAVAKIHLTVPRDQIQIVMGPGIQEVYAAIMAQGLVPTGPWFTYHHKRPDSEFDFDIGVPVSSPISPTGRVVAGELPAQRVARTVYIGGYEGLGHAWGEFIGWVAAQGLTPLGHLWEAYQTGPESGGPPSSWRTELNQPIAD